MNTPSATLAAQLMVNNQSVIDFVTACPSDYWDVFPDGEDRTICTIAFHIARSYELQADGVAAILNEHPLPEPFHDLDAYNTRMAAVDRGKTKAEAIELLRSGCDVLAKFLANLTEEELDHPAPVGPNLTIRHIVESAVAAHPAYHLTEMREYLQRLIASPLPPSG